MQRTKIIGTAVTTSTSPAEASSIDSATCVRLCNTHNQRVTVSISTSVGAATILSFDMPHDTVEFLDKSPTDVIFTSTSIQANKVGFTN